MATPNYIRRFTADNPGIMTLQGTNQYVVGKENVTVIDVALSADANMDGIIEQAEANLRRLLGIPQDYRVLFLQGGAGDDRLEGNAGNDLLMSAYRDKAVALDRTLTDLADRLLR